MKKFPKALAFVFFLSLHCSYEEKRFREAVELEKQGKEMLALYEYEKLIKSSPSFLPAYKRAGILFSKSTESLGVSTNYLLKVWNEGKDKETLAYLFSNSLETKDFSSAANYLEEAKNSNLDLYPTMEKIYFCSTKTTKIDLVVQELDKSPTQIFQKALENCKKKLVSGPPK